MDHHPFVDRLLDLVPRGMPITLLLRSDRGRPEPTQVFGAPHQPSNHAHLRVAHLQQRITDDPTFAHLQAALPWWNTPGQWHLDDTDAPYPSGNAPLVGTTKTYLTMHHDGPNAIVDTRLIHHIHLPLRSLTSISSSTTITLNQPHTDRELHTLFHHLQTIRSRHTYPWLTASPSGVVRTFAAPKRKGCIARLALLTDKALPFLQATPLEQDHRIRDVAHNAILPRWFSSAFSPS